MEREMKQGQSQYNATANRPLRLTSNRNKYKEIREEDEYENNESAEYLDENEMQKSKQLSATANLDQTDITDVSFDNNQEDIAMPKSLQSPKRDKNIYFTHRIQYEHSPINTRPQRSK